MQEMALSLHRTDQKVNFALLRLQVLQRDVGKAVGNRDLEAERAAVDAFNKARKHAEEARWNLRIHRQACGFATRNHEAVNAIYPIPPPMCVGQGGSTATEETNTTYGKLQRGELLVWRKGKMSEEERARYFKLPREERYEFLDGLLQADGV